MNKFSSQHLRLHDLLGALSYWGAATRLMLFGFVLFFASILAAIDTQSASELSGYIVKFIYVMSLVFLLDVGYVTIARTLSLGDGLFDRLIYLSIMVLLSLLIILPYFVVVPAYMVPSLLQLFLIVLFILAVRLVLGVTFSRSTRDE